MITADQVRERTETLLATLAPMNLQQALGHGRRIYGGAAFDLSLSRFMADPAGEDGAAFLAWVEQLAAYAAAVRAKA